MRIREINQLVVDLTGDKKLAKKIYDLSIFNVYDIDDDSSICKKAISPQDIDMIKYTSPRNFQFKLRDFFDFVILADTSRGIASNSTISTIFASIRLIALIIGFSKKFQKEINGDHAVLLNTIIIMREQGHTISESNAYSHFCKIKDTLNQDALEFGLFAELVNDLLNCKIISMTNGIISLEERVKHKTSLLQIYENIQKN